MTAIIDYDAGNLRSVEKAIALLGGDPVITRDRETILKADHVILPGVGAFGDAMEKLNQYGLTEVVREGIENGSYVYFVHSYYLKARDEAIVAASTEYGCHIHASVESGNVFGCQFHPEKSSTVGLSILKNFLSVPREV